MQARFSPDSRRIAVAHRGRRACSSTTWRPASPAGAGAGQARDTWPSVRRGPDRGHLQRVKAPTCRILEAETGRLVRSIPLHGDAETVAWSPDGTTLATPCDDRKIYLWDAATGIRRATLEGHTNGGSECGVPPRRHAAGQQRLGRPAAALGPGPGPALAEPGRVKLRRHFSQDGRIVVSLEDQLTTYQVDPALEYRTFAHASRRADSIMEACRSGTTAGCWPWARAAAWCSGTWPAAASSPSCRSAGPRSCMFEASGDLLTSGSIGVRRWPVRLDPDRGEFRIGPPRQLPLPAGFEEIAEDRSGRIVALAGHGHGLRRDPASARSSVGPLDDFRSVAVSPDGEWLATGSHRLERRPGLADARRHKVWPICRSTDWSASSSAPMGNG